MPINNNKCNIGVYLGDHSIESSYFYRISLLSAKITSKCSLYGFVSVVPDFGLTYLLW